MLTLPRYTFQRDDTDPRGRRYFIPALKKWEFSVTTLIDRSSDNSGLAAWRAWKGEEVADQIVHVAKTRGNRLHKQIEDYFNFGTLPSFCFLSTPYWRSILPYLKTITHAALIEGSVYHPDGVVGTPDFVGHHSCDPPDFYALDDWKSADKPIDPTKPAGRQKLYGYKLQLAAYTAGLNYTYADFGLNIRKANLLIAIPDAKYQHFILEEEELKQLFYHFKSRAHYSS